MRSGTIALAAAALVAGGALAEAQERRGALAGRDGHGARGTVTVVRDGDRLVVTFPADFRVTNTNAVLVGAGTAAGPDRATLVTRLPALSGAQSVRLAAGTAAPGYTAVWLWCDQHKAEAGVARLR
jgi:hypothetical protein